ncbi:MAG TPA: glycosyltransferase family 2 protein [Acidimicrobiales bacterium]|jgi:hypothetical protein|nr:glycosyltransferase family 2 protein [Acidimicrobiales bacterium]
MTDDGGGTDISTSAIVVTWNSADVIDDCLTSLRAALPPVGAEVIVVDNGSRDDTVVRVRSAHPDVVLIANEDNRGLAAANNQGLAAARGERYLICNPDVLVHAGAIEAMVAVLGRHPQAAWVVPRVLHEDGALQTSAGDLPTLRETLLGRQAARRRSPGSPTGFWWDGWAHDTEQVIGRGFECAYLVRRSAVAAVGPQDERYRLDWEGLDWTERFRRAGWEIWLSPEAEVTHLGGTSRRQVPFRSIRSQHKGMYLYFSDRRGAAWKPVLAIAFTVRGLIKTALTALGVPFYSWGHRDRRDHRAGSA